MRGKRPMRVNFALGIAKLCGYGGIGLSILAVFVSMTGVNWLTNVLTGLGIAALFGGPIFGYFKVRCPYCGSSLMLGGRLPSHLPDYCPRCGNALDETD